MQLMSDDATQTFSRSTLTVNKFVILIIEEIDFNFDDNHDEHVPVLSLKGVRINVTYDIRCFLIFRVTVSSLVS